LLQAPKQRLQVSPTGSKAVLPTLLLLLLLALQRQWQRQQGLLQLLPPVATAVAVPASAGQAAPGVSVSHLLRLQLLGQRLMVVSARGCVVGQLPLPFLLLLPLLLHACSALCLARA
jgi:hypothetical protein